MTYTFAGAALDLTSGTRSEEDLRRALGTLRKLAEQYRERGKDVPKGIADEIDRYEAHFGDER